MASVMLGPNSVTAREILDKASNDMGSGLAKDPEVQAQMMQVMANTYTNLGLYARAHGLTKSAFDTRMARLGPNDPKTLESMSLLGWILDRQGHYDEAEKLERQALADKRRVFGATPHLRLTQGINCLPPWQHGKIGTTRRDWHETRPRPALVV